MRLFNLIAVTHLVQAGDKYSASANERECLQNCKRSTNCQGKQITKENVPECIVNCRDQCTKERKDKISEVMARSSHHIRKVAQRQSENKAARAEHRQTVKDAQPPPMIKAFHELREKAKNDGTKDLANDFLHCLKQQKTDLGCDGSGPGEAWDCKREMVGNCLDLNSNYEGMGSKALVELAQKFRKSEETAAQTQARLAMKNDQNMMNDPKPPTEAPSAMDNAPKNKHGKVKVSLFKKELSKEKKGKIDTSDIGLDLVQDLKFEGESDNELDDRQPIYVDETEEIVYDIEEGEEEFNWFGDEDAEENDDAEDAEVEVPNEWGMKLNDMFNDPLMKEEVEDEAEEGQGEDERTVKKEPKKKVPLFKLQAKNSKNQDKPQKVKQVITKPIHGLAKLNHEQYVQEMCRCRTSMEHYRVKNYLHKWSDQYDSWHHHEETCKWCAYPSSKKCWQCQQHWQRASDNADNDGDRIRNEQIEMACFLYTRSVKSGKFKPMNGRHNDPCHMSQIHDGSFNAWHQNPAIAKDFELYHEIKNSNQNVDIRVVTL